MSCHQLISALIIVVLSSSYSMLTTGNYIFSYDFSIILCWCIADPTVPVWPAAFQETFNETSTLPIIGTGKNIQGTYYYDFDQKAV